KTLDVGEGQIARAGPGVLIGERVGHGVARERLSGDLLRPRDQSRCVQAAGLVKLRDAVEVIEKIVEEPRRARNLTEADCGVFHSFPLFSCGKREYGKDGNNGRNGMHSGRIYGIDKDWTQQVDLPLLPHNTEQSCSSCLSFSVCSVISV